MKKDVSNIVSLKIVLIRIQNLHKKISQEEDMAIDMNQHANLYFKKQMTIFRKLLKELGKRIYKETRSKSDGMKFITSNVKKVKCRITEKGQIVGEIFFDFYPFHLENFVKKNKLSFVKKVAVLLEIPKEYIDIRFHMTEDAK